MELLTKDHPLLRSLFCAPNLSLHISMCAYPQYQEMTWRHELPINANTDNSMCPKHLCSRYFFNLFSARYVISVSALTTMKLISLLLRLVTYGLHMTYDSAFFTTVLKVWITRMIGFFVSCPLCKLAVIKVSFSAKDLQVRVETTS